MLPGIRGHLIACVVLDTHASAAASRHAAEIERARRQMVRWRRRVRSMGPASGLRAMLEAGAAPLLAAFGVDRVADVVIDRHVASASIRVHGVHGVHEVHEVLGDRETCCVALVVPGWGERLDALWRTAVVEAGRRGAAWAVLFNGTDVRVIEASAAHSRRFLEIDLDVALEEERTFAALWTILRPASFAPAGNGGWLHGAARESERYAAGVCRSLRHGVLQASSDVVNALARLASGPVHHSFEQALTIVYRILFLLFAEARGLVPLWHPVYRESYSIEALREAAERHPPVPGLWDALRASCRLAHAGCRAGDLRVTAFNGRLFAPSGTPLAERSGLDDQAARRAVLALSTRPAPDRAGRERIAYHELGVEQLGAVYESLLDYEPKPEDAPAPVRTSRPASAKPITLVTGSDRRKATGTFYTPQPLAQYLVRQTLGALVRDRPPEAILALRVLDPAMGSGAFLVAACDFLARAYENALVAAGGCLPGDISPAEQRLIRRTVAERCLFGVDLNPMATQLARLSIWLASLAADRPLSFLDHHLTTGDSLLGTWLSCLRRAPASGPRRETAALPLFDEERAGAALQAALPVRFTLADTPNDTAEQVRRKERALAALNRPDSALSRWRRVADLWCAHWFSPAIPAAAFGALSDAILTGQGELPDHTTRSIVEHAEAASAERRFFHWELEFPEVFFDARGARLASPGFDAVLGNPPWDMIRADSGSADRRSRARSEEAGVLRFARDAGVYEASSTGHANRYQLFVERALALAKPGGRIGLVLPSGVASDHGSGPLRRLLFSRCRVETLVGFDNRLGVFPIHRSVRFVLLCGENGAPTARVACRLGETDPHALDAIDAFDAIDDQATAGQDHFPVRLAPALLERLSGPELAVPDLRTRADLAIVERAVALFRPLGADDGWGVRFGRELNATDDRDCFRTVDTRGLPVVEGKQIAPFAADLAGARWKVPRREAAARLGDRWRRPRLAYRDIASATNRVTLIAAVLPGDCVSTHTVFCLRTALPLEMQHFLCGLFNSLVVNYLARLRVTVHVTTAIVERLPIPREDQAGRAFHEIAAIARRLVKAADAGAAARLNAVVATLYQLSAQEFAHVLGTFPLVPQTDRDAAFGAFEALERANPA